MKRSRTVSMIAVAVLGTLLASAFRAPPQHPHDPQHHHEQAAAAKEAGGLFAERCVNCHVAPDLAYATDRAWVEQVRETA